MAIERNLAEPAEWSEEDTTRAERCWADYQQAHDISGRIGQTVGIDPQTGKVWFGASIPEVSRQVEAEGSFRPLFFARVGYDYYYRKGGRR
jgi:hypothetical protein